MRCSSCGKTVTNWDDSPPVYCDKCLPVKWELPEDDLNDDNSI